MEETNYNLNNETERPSNAPVGGTSRQQKCIIISSLIVALLIVAVVIILLILYLNSEEEPSHNQGDKIGQIDCLYDIKDASKEISLLGDSFEKLSSLEIYINDERIDNSKKYKFEKEGEYKVKFEVYEDLNMDYMYKDILELKGVNMTSTKNAKITSMKSTFENCQNIKEVNIRGFNTQDVESMNKLFYGTNLSISDIEGLEINNVKDLSFMFAFSRSKTLDFFKLNTSQATNMSYMFYGSDSLETLNLSSFDTSNVEDMSHMFEGCNNLRRIEMRKFVTDKVTNMNSMFANCSSIEQLNLNDFNTKNVKDMGKMFQYSSIRRLEFRNFDTTIFPKLN